MGGIHGHQGYKGTAGLCWKAVGKCGRKRADPPVVPKFCPLAQPLEVAGVAWICGWGPMELLIPTSKLGNKIRELCGELWAGHLVPWNL